MSADSAAQFEPEVSVRRRRLEQRRDELRLIGFNADLAVQEVEAQPHRDGTVEVRHGEQLVVIAESDYLRDKRETRDNAYAAARRLQDLLDQLPCEQP